MAISSPNTRFKITKHFYLGEESTENLPYHKSGPIVKSFYIKTFIYLLIYCLIDLMRGTKFRITADLT